MSDSGQVSQSPLDFSTVTLEETMTVDSHQKKGTYRTQDGFVKESIEHECEKRRDSSVLTDINIDEYHLSSIHKNSPQDEVRNMMESHYQMIEYISDNLKMLLMHGGLQLSELLLIVRTRIKPSISLSTADIRQNLQKICPFWWDTQAVGDIVNIANEIVGQKNATVNKNSEIFGKVESTGRIDRSNSSLTDEERKLGKSYAAIVQEMTNHYDEHQDRVDRFFYEHTVVYAKLSDGEHVACICFDPRQLDPAANSAVRMRARKALLAHSSSIKYTIILLNLDEIDKLSCGTDSFARERLHAQLKGGTQNRCQTSSENAQGPDSMSHSKHVSETTIAQQASLQESQRELMYDMISICNKCSQLGKAITGEDKIHQNNPTDSSPLPFVNQFP